MCLSRKSPASLGPSGAEKRVGRGTDPHALLSRRCHRSDRDGSPEHVTAEERCPAAPKSREPWGREPRHKPRCPWRGFPLGLAGPAAWEQGARFRHKMFRFGPQKPVRRRSSHQNVYLRHCRDAYDRVASVLWAMDYSNSSPLTERALTLGPTTLNQKTLQLLPLLQRLNHPLRPCSSSGPSLA